MMPSGAAAVAASGMEENELDIYRLVIDFIFILFYLGVSNVVCIMRLVCGSVMGGGFKDRVFERLLVGIDELDDGVTSAVAVVTWCQM